MKSFLQHTFKCLLLAVLLTHTLFTAAETEPKDSFWTDEGNYAEPSGWVVGATSITITSARELAWIAIMVNGDQQTGADPATKGFEGVTITLATDLDLNGHYWTPIGLKLLNDFNKPALSFKGAFCGDNKTIDHMQVKTEAGAGLFGYIEKATVKDIILTNCSIEKIYPTDLHTLDNCNISAGGIVAKSVSSTIENCSVTGNINFFNSKGGYVGGIAGQNGAVIYSDPGPTSTSCESHIKNCSFKGELQSTLTNNASSGQSAAVIGGIASVNIDKSTIDGCSADLTIQTNQATAGGIVNQNNGTIQNCTSKGIINVTHTQQVFTGVGGIAGSLAMGAISNCTSFCDITLDYVLIKKYEGLNNVYATAGGITGRLPTVCSISNCKNQGDITINVTTENDQIDYSGNTCMAGGIVGWKQGVVLQCSSSGDITTTTHVTNTSAYAGGIAGMSYKNGNGYGNTPATSINTCEVEGNISACGDICYSGGIVGFNCAPIEKCISKANIKAINENTTSATIACAGGIAGQFSVENYFELNCASYGYIRDCHSDGESISASGAVCYVGGIAGLSLRPITHCYSTVKAISAEGTTNYVGGLTGRQETALKSYPGFCANGYSTSDVLAIGKLNYVGGITGYNKEIIESCYATGRVEAQVKKSSLVSNTKSGTIDEASYVGGIVGYTVGKDDHVTHYCLALNKSISNYTDNIGRIAGNSKEDGNDQFTIPDNFASPKIPAPSEVGWLETAIHNGSLWDGATYPFDPIEAWDISDPNYLPKLKQSDETTLFPDQKDVPNNVIKKYIITIQTTDGGTLSVTDTSQRPIIDKGEVAEGTEINIEAKADEGYLLKTFTVAGNEFTSGSTYTIGQSDIEIVAIFAKPSCIVTLPMITGATINPIAGDHEVVIGSDFTFSLALNADYNQSEPVVIVKQGNDPETTLSPEGINPYTYKLSNIQKTSTILISGIVKNPVPPIDPPLPPVNPEPDPEPTPPAIIYYTVTLPAVEGVTTLPGAGRHEVKEGDSFNFTLSLSVDYDQSHPIVTVDEKTVESSPSESGKYIIENVHSNLQITITGIEKNRPSSNVIVNAGEKRIYAARGTLYIQSPVSGEVQIVNLRGNIVRIFSLQAGTNQVEDLKTGIYLVRVAEGNWTKIIVSK